MMFSLFSFFFVCFEAAKKHKKLKIPYFYNASWIYKNAIFGFLERGHAVFNNPKSPKVGVDISVF